MWAKQDNGTYNTIDIINANKSTKYHKNTLYIDSILGGN